MQIHEDLTLGIDLGIASCGWALLRRNGHGGQIVDWGTRTFDVPETDKDRTPTNQLRRSARGMRRVIRRRRQRMNEIRRLFKLHGLLGNDTKSALWIRDGSLIDPWTCRAQGLDRKLTAAEFAVALGHVAKHRGFKSNSKRNSNEPASDDSKMLKEIEQTRDRLKTYRTVGEMFAKDSEFATRKRNRDGDYSRSVLRNDQDKEVRLLFDAQRRAGNAAATRELEESFILVAFFQRPLADSEDKVGACPFEENERRAAKRSPSFEKFRFLSRLTSLRLETAGGEQALLPEQILEAVADFGNQPGMTLKRLRKILDLDDGIRFAGISIEDEKDRDVVNRSKGNGCMQGTRALRRALSEAAWQSLAKMPDLLDRISFVLTFREDRESIRAGLEALGLAEVVLDVLMKGVEDGSFSDFKGAGHLSAKACRNIIPFLMKGMVYSDACKAARYNHTRRPETKLEEINNPVARKSLTEALKHVNAIVQVYGLPGRIHVELARDVGKSRDERDEITRGIEKRNRALDRLAEQFREETGRERRRESDDLLRFQLWKEQHGRCAYCDGDIHVNDIASGDNATQVDHILPWSRSGDDSPVNKTLCHAKCNQEKRGRTPYEWFGKDEARWQRFAACVDSNKEFKGRKKRNYLLRDAGVLEEKFRPRNLNDTRYATRLLLDMLARMYPDDVRTASKDQKEAVRATEHWFETEKRELATIRVASRPGPLTDRLRRGWGIQDLKKELQPDGEKRKSDDRHHALDALIVAATSQGALQRLTTAFQKEERIGGHRDFSNLDPPWPGFVEEVREKFERIFVSRAERHRARGEAHAATIRQVVDSDGEKLVYERRSVETLTAKDLERIKDTERNRALVNSIGEWIAAGKPKGTWPKSPQGDDVKKVSVRTNKKPDVLVRDGAADRGEMVRVDVFRKSAKNGKPQFYLVPIYPHQVADRQMWAKPPNRAVQAHIDESVWPEMTAEYEFLFSIWPLSFLEVEKPDGTFIDGYFRGMDRGSGNLEVSVHYSKDERIRGIGARGLRSLRKISVDRLGNRSPVAAEKRTWHGAVCT